MLNDYIGELRKNPLSFSPRKDYPKRFDYKYGARSDDLFQVGDQWLRADQFGNFAAGYAGTKTYGGWGHLAMVLGGIAVARRDYSGEHWFDGTSRPMINAGAANAYLETTRDPNSGEVLPNRVETLTSPAGCAK